MYKVDFEGNKIVVGDMVWMGWMLLIIFLFDVLVIKVQFDEVDIVKLVFGIEVKVILDVYLEIFYLGIIVLLGEVYKEKLLINLSIVFDVEIILYQIDDKCMWFGMKVKIEVLEVKV